MSRLFLLWTLCLCAPGVLFAQSRATEIEAGFSREALNGGRQDWTSRYVEAIHAFAPRQNLYGALRQTERFGLRDSEISAGYSHPFSSRVTGTAEGTYSSEHNVLPQSSVLGQLAWQVGQGWVLTGGLRHSSYTLNDADLLLAGVERYWDAFRAGYTLYNGRPEGAGSASAHRFSFDWFYGEHSRIGVGYTTGREVENVGPPLGVTSTDVRGWGVFGRHWLTPSWALSYEVLSHTQGTLYRRQGARIGLRYRF